MDSVRGPEALEAFWRLLDAREASVDLVLGTTWISICLQGIHGFQLHANYAFHANACNALHGNLE